MEKLIIQNFAGIQKLEIEVGDVNVLIGPQASGKSVTAKLLYYFKFFVSIHIVGFRKEFSKEAIRKDYIEEFKSFFPEKSWSSSEFEIEYRISEDTWINLIREKGELTLSSSKDIEDRLSDLRDLHLSQEKDSMEYAMEYENYLDSIVDTFQSSLNSGQVYVPAGRSLIVNLEASIFSFIDTKTSLDPFLVKFGSMYQYYKGHGKSFNFEDKGIDNIIEQILKGKYQRENSKDFLVHSDGRKVELLTSSSGQQEIFPLMVVLRKLVTDLEIRELTLYIEEPEAHLSPSAQKLMIRLLTRIYNQQKGKIKLFVTTHSPYILASFNNLMYAGQLSEENQEKVQEIIPEEEILNPNKVKAYSLNEQKEIEDLISKETGLISENLLDAVSSEIGEEFDQLLDLDN